MFCAKVKLSLVTFIVMSDPAPKVSAVPSLKIPSVPVVVSFVFDLR